MEFQSTTIELSKKTAIKRRSLFNRIVRRLVDLLLSIPLIILLLPVFILFIILVKLTSKGPVFYLQERIGLFEKPFKIIKFRSMYVDAEKDGPGLSYDTDPRVTKLGGFMRANKVDELPQLFNVLIGDMTFVGPRPERRYYIDQILERNPDYRLLHNVKPGITSLGQVKYGYAQNIDEMLARLELDLDYVKNKSFTYDMKIVWYTFLFLIRKKA